MTLPALLGELAARDIRLRLEGESLAFSAPQGVLTAELRSTIIHHKAALMEMLRAEAARGDVAALRPRQTGVPVPLTTAQERLWFVDQMSPGDPGFNITRNVWLRGPLDAELLERSLAMIVDRHEVLRSVVDSSRDEPQVMVQPPGGWRMRRVNLSGASDGEFAKLIRKEADHHFDLARGPLFRAALAQKGPDEHLLLLNFHHLVFDGASTALFFRKLSLIYSALRSGEVPQLEPLPIQFGDFAVWQRERLKGAALDREISYWKEQLGGKRELAILPTDLPRSEWRTHRVAQVLAHLPKARVEVLEAFARREGITLYMLLLGAYQTVLHRYTGGDEVRVGSPVSARTRVETERLLGFFLNVLVMRAGFVPGGTVRQFLQGLKETVLSAFAHREVPMEQLAVELRDAVDPHGAGFFQAFFNLLNFEESELSLPGIEAHHVPLRLTDAAFELSLFMQPGPDGLRAAWNYQVDLFLPETIERLSASFLAVLDTMVANPEAQVERLPLLPALEQCRMLGLGKGPEQAVPADCSLTELIERQAARTPEAVAVRLGETALTYGELDLRANQLAHYLRRSGLGPDVLAGVFLKKSPEMIVAVLAVLKAGGAYLPLDPATPPERLRLILGDARAAIVLTESALAPALDGFGLNVLRLDTERAAFAAEPIWSPPVRISPSHLAYAIYTSGSSGRPKGVLIEHRSVVNHTVSAIAAYGLTPADRVLQFASLSFDASAEEIFPALASGAELVLRPETMIETPENFLARTGEWGLTVLDLPTAYWHELVWAMKAEHLRWPVSVRVVIIGGERARLDDLTSWRQLAGPAPRLFNTYGPTEATIVATRWEAPAKVAAWAKLREVPIGIAISNTHVCVLDQGLNPVPFGVPGELHIGGAGLARGYLNRPELMAEKFIQHPQLAGLRLYKTGDLVRQFPDGNLEFCGRVDQQVKIRGFRIELGEIETLLAAHPGVAGCAVSAVADAQGEQRLVGYVVPAGAAPSARELRAFLLKTLPDYMVPAVFTMLETLPLNTSGKVDRRALPAPAAAPVEVEAGSFIGPKAGLEAAVAKVWGEVLRRERVGAEDNFFELGGHSLLATRAIARLRHLTARDVPLRWIFEVPILRAFVARIETELPDVVAEFSGAAPQNDAPAFPERVAGRPLLLSDAQEALRFLHRLEPESAAYNIVARVKLTGPLQVKVLQRVFTELFSRHEILRATIGERDGRGELCLHPLREFELPVLDLSERAPEERETLAEQRVREEADSVFDLATGPLIRARVLRLGGESHWLVINVHHIIFDGWSMELLLDEMALLYQAFLAGQPSPLPAVRQQFADFVAWQRDRLQGDFLEREMSFWRKELAGAPEGLDLPADFARGAVGNAAGQVEFDIPAALVDQVKALAQAEQGTLFMALLGVFQVLLARSSGQEEVCVGSPVAGRSNLATEKLMGYFISMLVFRGSVAGDPTFREFFHQVRERTLGAFSHQELPLDRIVAAVNPHRTAGSSPLFQAALVLNNETMEKSRIPGLTLQAKPVHNAAAKFDLTLVVRESAVGLHCVLEYRRGRFSAETIRLIGQRFQRLLEQAVANADERVSRLEWMSPHERERVLGEWNATTTPFPRMATVPELFEREAARRPQATALVLRDERLSYGELNRRANQLAHWLRQQGVGPEANVAVCLDRGIEMIVALLGILKSGGAYVPLDISQPPERQKFIVQDARPSLVLTHSSLARGLQGVGAPLFSFDELAPALARQSEENVSAGVQPTTRAYVLYTSGSTGRPKGVLVNHRAILRLVRETNYAQFGPEEVFLQLAPVAFDASTFEIWGSLLNGGSLVIMPPGLSSVADIEGMIQQHHVTTLWLTAGLFHHVVETRVEALRGLRQLLAGGDVLAPAAVQKVLRELPGCRMINGYGPTENTTFTCCHTVTLADDLAGAVPVGRPISNTRVYVLDARMQPVPIGVPGELFIAGDGLASGYLNLPELTAEKFVPDPFAKGVDEKMYRSGDRVRWRADGTIEFLGRLDNQVKIRGFRVEPGEIEAALGELPGIQLAAAVAHEVRPGDKRLVGYYVLRPGAEVSVATVKQHLAGRLPAYLVPSALVVVDTLPLNANGKVDRAALARRRLAIAADAAYVAPRNATEETLAKIWSAVLNVERVGVDDTFFELGGHSLVALQVMSRINQEFGIKLPLRRLFETPTVAGLAAQIAAGQPPHGSPAAAEFVSLSPLRARGARPPLFILSGGDSDEAELLLVSRTAQQMDAGQPVFGFVARGHDGRRAPHGTLGEIARDYVTELRRVQPKGPYFLGGVCLGCLVAAEMAAQLEAAGERVSALLFVVPRPPPTRREIFFEMNPVGKTLRHLARLATLPAQKGLIYLWYRIRNAGRRLAEPLPSAGTSNYSVRVAHLRALLGHRVRPVAARAFFLMDQPQLSGSWSQAWRHLIGGGITPVALEGDHHSCLREHSGDTARCLQAALDGVAREQGVLAPRGFGQNCPEV